MRCERDIIQFFFEGLRKHMKKKNLNGIGINVLNNRMMNKNFRPLLPKQLYPSLKALIEECWDNKAANRPAFDDIVLRLGGVISLEVNRLPEPDVSATGDEHGFAEDDPHNAAAEGREDENHRLEVELVSLRRSLEEEKVKSKRAEDLEKQVEEEHKMRVELEEALHELQTARLGSGK